MKRSPILTLLALAQVALLVGCERGSDVPSAPQAALAADAAASDPPQFSGWSEPVHLDAPVNSPYRELGAELSPDELSLYFGSDRPDPGAQGAFDIWVSRRACRECPWEEPVNLGPNINSPGGDGSPALSRDGLLLFFSGSRSGGEGGEDIWVSRRTDPNDDLSWGPPANLGPYVNTAGNEGGPTYVPALEGGAASLYFDRQGATLAGSDMFQVRVTRDVEALEPAAPLADLNSSSLDLGPTLRGDGREVFFWSQRVGGADIWGATRRSPHDPWSAPQALGPPVNTLVGGELQPRLSWDGRTLLFSGTASRGGSLGFQDLWMSTRTPGGQ